MPATTRLLGALCMASVTPSLHAQETTAVDAPTGYALPEIIVTAKPMAARPIVTRTVNRRDIAAWNARSAADALVQTPGVNVQYGGSSGDARAWMRGFRHRDVLILFDGIPIASAFEGNIDLNEISLDNVDHVNVTKSAPSVIYGPNGLGGVIDFIPLKAPAGNTLSSTLELGANDARHARLSHGGDIGTARYFLSGNYDTADAFDLSGDFRRGLNQSSSERVNSDYLRKNVFASISAPATRIGALSAFFNVADAERGLTPEVGSDDPDFERLTGSRRQTFGVSASLDAIPLSLKLYHNSYESDLTVYNDPEYTDVDEIESADDYSIGAMAYSTLNLGEHHSLVLSGALARDEFDGIGALEAATEASLKTFTLAVEDQITAGERWSIAVGGIATRFEQPQDDRTINAFSPQAVIGYEFSDTLTLHASVAERTRFPKLRELYRRRWGNASLHEQTTVNYELGAQLTHSPRWQSDLSWFKSDVDDLIERPDRRSTYQNLESVTFKGVELASAIWLSESVYARLGYTYLDAGERLPDGGTRQLRSRARHSGYGELRVTLPREFQLSINAVHARGLHDLDGDGDHVRLSSYTVAHMKLAKKFSDQLGVYVSVANAMDEDYQHRLGYPRAGRLTRIGLSYDL